MNNFSGLLFAILLIIHGGFSITLDGSWTGILKNCGNITTNECANVVTFAATVPGGIYSDLIKANVIPNNFVGSNDVNNRWVGKQSVTYVRYFDVNESFLQTSKVALVFHGLDTFATITLNEHEIGKASNMFIRYTFDVTEYLKQGTNTLKVSFASPIETANTLYNEQKSKYIVPPVCVPSEYNGECHVNHIRKMQASFSWDWGPAFPSMGIWKSVELIPVNEISVVDITADIYKGENAWNIVITVFGEVPEQDYYKPVPCHLSSTLRINEKSSIHNSSTTVFKIDNKVGHTSMSLRVPLDRVHQWWPNGYGEQYLYKLSVTVSTSKDVTRKEIRIGFRTVELVEEPLEKGLSFYFRINGVPIFAKGSNFIPASVLPELGSKDDTVRHLLMSAKETHMNMLRVWGGGLYESDLFYDLADEYGIMIWQDFMFACGMYPTTETFLHSVRQEVIQNVRRLKNHPSVVLWAGNNENEAALYGNWYKTGSAQIYKDDYVKLYVDVIKKEMEQLDNTRPYVVSSPSNGAYTEKYNYVGEDPYSKFYGDVHYYNYIDNGWNMHRYPRARFSSEYGFQSLPSIYTILPAIDDGTDLNIDSIFMRHRQHLPFGTVFMKSLIKRNFRLPESNDTLKDFMHFIYLSQINQAVSVRIQTEFYRQAMSEVNEIGEGMTMGALYWQLNDVWQAPSWSSIDFDGRWKMLHYYAKEFFAPVIVTHYMKGTDLSIYIVSDVLSPVTNTTLELHLYKCNKMTPIHSHVYRNITVEANRAIQIHDESLTSWFSTTESRYECESDSNVGNCITTLTLKDKDGVPIAPINYVYPAGIFRYADVPIANILVKIGDNHLPGRYWNYPDFEIELVTDSMTFFVWLESGNIRGRFSENGFHMFEKTKRIVFHSREAITPEMLRENINLTTLSDVYNPNHISITSS